MKHLARSMVAVVLVAGQASADGIEDRTFTSQVNNREVKIKVYTPPGYNGSTDRYPVVYNLHGAGGGSPERQWDRCKATLTDAMDSRKVRPMIYVFVDGLGDTFFIDYATGKPKVETMIVKELIPWVDANYRTIADRRGRGVDGFSMGGFGCLMLAFRHPELFCTVVSYGAALIDPTQDKPGDRPTDKSKADAANPDAPTQPDPNATTYPRAGRWGDQAYSDQYNPRALARTNADAIRSGLKVRVVCGDADGLYQRNVTFKDLLKELEIPCDWVSVPGVAHDTKGLFNRVGLESMKFMQAAFDSATKDAPAGKVGSAAPPAGKLPRLKVSDNSRFLVTADGKPFFYLADTAWELFHRCTREEADLYLRTRADQGFTVVQAVALAELDGLTDPNPYGHTPLADNDPTRPNEKYFEHVDWVVDRAGELGLYVALLPTWGDKVNRGKRTGGEVFTPANARVYGEWIGRRYKDRAVIWVLGGDRPVETDAHRNTFRAMAEGVRAAVGRTQLVTFHPYGGRTSARDFHAEPWLDFNMMQSGHGRKDSPNYATIAADYARAPAKPCMDAESCYESHRVRATGEMFTPQDVRKLIYWGLFAGGHGATYGCHTVWQMWQPPRSGRGGTGGMPWKEALGLPAATQMRHVRALIESRPYLTRIPDQALLPANPGDGGDHCRATRDEAGTYAFVYVPTGKPVTADLGRLSGERIKAWWYDPRTGDATPAGEFARAGTREFDPPGEPGADNDWVLVLDDAGKNYPPPGQ